MRLVERETPQITLLEAARIVARGGGLDAELAALAGHVCNATGALAAAIYLLDPTTQQLVVAAGDPQPPGRQPVAAGVERVGAAIECGDGDRVAEHVLVPHLEEEAVTCCYAIADKFWLADPDGNAWEFWVRHDDEGETLFSHTQASTCCAPGCAAARGWWSRRCRWAATGSAIAKEALKRNVGARGLRIILEELMLDLMYTIPSQRDVKQIVINEEVVASRVQPIMLYKKAG